MSSSSPPSKRIKLESLFQTSEDQPANSPNTSTRRNSVDLSHDHCSICLQPIVDRTVIPTCAHEFCFECILVWSEQSRRCPLCSQFVGEYLIHHIRSRYDYQKHYLVPLRTSPAPLQPLAVSHPSRNSHNVRRVAREREWGRRERQKREEADQLDRAVAKRRWIYEHDLYVKHVASNSYTRYRPYPTPAQFAASPDLISRTTIFLRRELRVWVNLDVEFLTTFIVSLMKAIDIRSESAIKLLAEFLDMDAPYVEGRRHVNAEHFAHEVYCFVRSPYKDLFIYDTVVQYDTPSHIPPPPEQRSVRRWHVASHSRSRSRSGSPSPRSRSQERYNRHPPRQRSRSRLPSWSPSGRRYSTSRERRSDQLPPVDSPRGRSYDHDERAFRREQRNGWNREDNESQRHSHLSELDDVDMGKPREVPQSSEGQPMERTDVVDVKGKGRATVASDDVPSQSTANVEVKQPEDYNLRTGRQQEESPGISTQTPRNQISPERRRLPRTLLESVQAHLAPTKSRPKANGKGKEKEVQSVSSHAAFHSPLPDSSNKVPSLLVRLSEPNTGQDGEPSHLPLSIPSRDTTVPSALESSQDHNSKMPVHMSSPETMTRTRTRVAEIKDRVSEIPEVAASSTLVKGHQDGSQTPSAEITTQPLGRLGELNSQTTCLLDASAESPSTSGTTHTSTHPDRSSEHGSVTVSSTSVSQGQSPSHDDRYGTVDCVPSHRNVSNTSALDLRARLLLRLEQEKRVICKAQLGDSSLICATPISPGTSPIHKTIRASADETLTPIISSFSSEPYADSQAKEAKLRTRAKLRVRLAAAKNANGGIHQEAGG